MAVIRAEKYAFASNTVDKFKKIHKSKIVEHPAVQLILIRDVWQEMGITFSWWSVMYIDFSYHSAGVTQQQSKCKG